MPDYVRHDGMGKILQTYVSVDPSMVEGVENVIEVSRGVAEGVTKYHKVENSKVVEMTQAEKDALTASEAQAEHYALLARIDKYDVTNVDLITALVKRINVRIPANPITKAEIITQIKADLGI